MMNFMCKCAEKYGEHAPLVMRVAVGVIFLAHGYQKWTGGVDNVATFFASAGIPLAAFFAYLVVYLELFGGALLILGIFTHWLAKLFAIEMAVAFFFVHAGKGFFLSNGGYEFVLLLFAASVSLVITGGGKWALENKFWGMQSEKK